MPELQKWMAYNEVNGKPIHIGFFASEEEAVSARERAEQSIIEYCLQKFNPFGMIPGAIGGPDMADLKAALQKPPASAPVTDAGAPPLSPPALPAAPADGGDGAKEDATNSAATSRAVTPDDVLVNSLDGPAGPASGIERTARESRGQSSVSQDWPLKTKGK